MKLRRTFTIVQKTPHRDKLNTKGTIVVVKF